METMKNQLSVVWIISLDYASPIEHGSAYLRRRLLRVNYKKHTQLGNVINVSIKKTPVLNFDIFWWVFVDICQIMVVF
jgi:hypothetical protein